MQVTQEHVSAGCNRVVGALDWGNDHSVAYAAHNLVCLYDAEVRHNAILWRSHLHFDIFPRFPGRTLCLSCKCPKPFLPGILDLPIGTMLISALSKVTVSM